MQEAATLPGPLMAVEWKSGQGSQLSEHYGPQPLSTQIPGPGVSPWMAALLPALMVLLQSRGNTINHRLMETGADGDRGGGEAARLYLAKPKAHSAKENVSGFSFEEC